MEGDLEGAVWLRCFHFAATGGVKMEKLLPLRRRRVFVLARHDMVTWSKCLRSKGVLWKIIGVLNNSAF